MTKDDFAGSGLLPIVAPSIVSVPEFGWSDEDWKGITGGHFAGGMDDKWHAYVVGTRLYLYRSWTGRCIYEAEFKLSDNRWSISEAVVTTVDYTRSSDEDEASLLATVIEVVILNRWNPALVQDSLRCLRSKS